MIQLLNRFAWALSIALGAGVIAITDIDSEAGVIIAIALTLCIKAFVLSKSYIEKRVRFFYSQLQSNNPGQTNQTSSYYEVSTPSNLSDSSGETSQLSKNQEKENPQLEHDAMTQDKNPIMDQKTNLQERTQDAATPLSNAEQIEQEKVLSKPEIEAKTATSLPLSHKATSNKPLQDLEEAIETPSFWSNFGDDIIGKIGAIFVFIGMSVFLSGVFVSLGGLGKVIMGFAIGFAIFAWGFRYERKSESKLGRILMGLSFLIHYLVILSARYLIEGGGFFDEFITFVLLFINTLGIIITSNIYKSKALLVFGFVLAYIIPFIIGSSSADSYMLMAYTVIITLGAMYMSKVHRYEELLITCFALSNIIFLIAPIGHDNFIWITKVICINLIGISSIFLGKSLSQKFKDLCNILLISLFFISGILGTYYVANIGILEFLLLAGSLSSLLVTAYILNTKDSSLYSIGTLGYILGIAPVIIISGNESPILVSAVLSAFVFGVLHIGYSVYRIVYVTAKNLSNIILGTLIGALYLSGVMYFYSYKSISPVLIGALFIGLAAIYASIAYLVTKRFGYQKLWVLPDIKNYVSSMIGISLAQFTLAIALVFTNHPSIVAMIWVIESGIMLFIAGKLKAKRSAIVFIILLALSIVRYITANDLSLAGGEYILLLPSIGVLISLIGFEYIIQKRYLSFFTKDILNIHLIIHIIGLLYIFILQATILELGFQLTILLFAVIWILALRFFYKYIQEERGVIFTTVLFFASYFLHTFEVIRIVDAGDFTILVFLKSLIIAAIGVVPIVIEKLKEETEETSSIFPPLGIYIFITSSFYIPGLIGTYNLGGIIDPYLPLTLYWGILLFITMLIGIKRDIIALRTTGLYLLILIVIKVLFFDIQSSSSLLKFIVFMGTGVLLIILSGIYTKRFGSKYYKTEFDIKNIFPNTDEVIEPLYDTTETELENQAEKIAQEAYQDINEKPQDLYGEIMNTFSSDIKSVTLTKKDDGSTMGLRSPNLIKIAKYVHNLTGKSDFEAGELRYIEQQITEKFKSTLPLNQQKRISEVLGKFVESGGKMEFNYK